MTRATHTRVRARACVRIYARAYCVVCVISVTPCDQRAVKGFSDTDFDTFLTHSEKSQP